MLDLDKEIEALESTLVRLKELKGHQAEAVGMVVKWQPKGGDWFGFSGGVATLPSSSAGKKFGLERQTKEQAERTVVEMRRFNRLLALRDELCGDDVVDWSSDSLKYYVFYSYTHKRWLWTEVLYIMTTTVYFTTENAAQRACDMLNSGEVEL